MACKLSSKVISALRGPATVADGAGLYLQITGGGTASWLYRYQLAGRRRWMGLGPYPTISASKARQERDKLRKLVKAGVDPLAEREAARGATAAARVAAERDAVTFRHCAQQYIEGREQEWRNSKHRQQWVNTMDSYVFPVMGDKPVSEIDTADLLAALRPIWLDKTETAKRVRGRIENILDYARSVGLREGDNPARWKSHLAYTLPSPTKLANVQHHRALPYKEAPALATELAEINTTASRATLLTLLCAVRTKETLEAQWAELDLDASLWTIPGHRMKTGKPHRVPLSEAAAALLRQQEQVGCGHLVFPGSRPNRPLSGMAMMNTLKRSVWLERTTVHGLRSTFRDWVADCTNYPDRLAEVALAHQLSDRVQAAYHRSDMMKKRRGMMEAWARFLTVSPAFLLKHP